MSDHAWLRFPAFLVAGAIGGLLALGLDELAVRIMAGYWVPVRAAQVTAYVVIASATGGVARLLTLRRRHGHWSWGLAGGFFGVYLPATAERVAHVAPRNPPAVQGVASLVGVLALIGLALLLRRVSSSYLVAFGCAGAMAAIGLAANRNLVEDPLAAGSLGADLAIAFAVFLVAVASRTSGVRRLGSIAGAALLLGGLIVGSRPAPEPLPPVPADPSPHLILVVIDTLRQDVFSSVVAETPEGRAFAERLAGADWYGQAVATAPWTSPSMASMFTGVYPPEHGFRSGLEPQKGPYRALTTAIPTLAERLRDQGYATYGIVTNPILHRSTGLVRGIGDYRHLIGPTVKLPLLTALTRYARFEKDYYQPAGRVAHELDRVLDDLESVDNPIFLWLHLMEPHHPLHDHPGLAEDPGEQGLRSLDLRYRREVRVALATLADMFDDLRTAGIWENAVVAIVSDHGEMFPSDEHDNGSETIVGHRAKTYGHGHALYQELVHVPFVVRPAGPPQRDRTVGDLVDHTDLIPILGRHLRLDLDAATPPTGTSESMKRNGRRTFSLMSGVQHGAPHVALRNRRHKLIHYLHGDRGDELYDLHLDPGERRNLVGERVGLQNRLGSRLQHVVSSMSPPEEPGQLMSEEDERARLRALGYVD